MTPMPRWWPPALIVYTAGVVARLLLRDLFRSPVDPTDKPERTQP